MEIFLFKGLLKLMSLASAALEKAKETEAQRVKPLFWDC